MRKLLKISALLAIVVGVIMTTGGIWALVFTYNNVSQENIVTPDDASIPGTPVRGPWTLKSQADVIRKHVLQKTDGKTYSEIPSQIPQVDEEGKPVLGNDGKPIMVPNEARNIWITATTLMTALHLGTITYLFSGLIILLGSISVWTGFVYWQLAKKY